MSALPQSVNEDFEVFKKQYGDFIEGRSDSLLFKTIRVPFGIYEQREANTYMVRVKLSAGYITPAQLLALADISIAYANGSLHVTTRGGVQLHYVKIENFLNVIEALHKNGLTGRGGGGNTVRNITADPYSGIAKDQIFDVTPYALALNRKMLEQKDSYALPRKYKIAFSASQVDRGGATLIDVGFIAKIKDGKRGFSVFVAGGMGAKPKVGVKFLDFLPEEEIFLLSQAIKEVFNEKGNRKNKNNARLRFLVEELGLGEFRKEVDFKIEKIKSSGVDWRLNFESFSEIAPIENPISPRLNDEQKLWLDRYAIPQRQSGYFSAKIALQLGDISAQNAKLLAKKLIEIAPDRDTLRFGNDQNIYLRNLSLSELVDLYETVKQISPIASKAAIIGDSVVCTGAATCQLGITIPRGAIASIEKKLKKENIALDSLQGFKIHISGCPNSCGRHHIADLGFFGKVLREDGVAYPAYSILVGAKVGENITRFAKQTASVSAYYLPSFISDLLKLWIDNKSEYKSFADWIDSGGEEEVVKIANKYAKIPSFDEDKNPYYDYTANEIFSLKGRGAGECSAGMYDLIDADKKALQIALEENNFTAVRALAARMLLITRGEEARSESEVLAAFKKLFIDTGLIGAAFTPLLEGDASAKVVDLAKAVVELYATMDNSLKFAVEREKKIEVKPKQNANRFKDYRGVSCPMNFVKTKMDLAQMKSGEVLDILLDDGAPIDNVPRSVEGEGHTILEQTKQNGDYWLVKIRKK
ncbi:MAG: sulfurtransferase TusA family protein [Helicobacteraceae bacterium]|jgi:sulfite reductase (ferredoxin)|nr:sulfurtransferase TusA family protein [Helicobacteraceae bacterium]